jgi:uncharacterized protein (TIGR03437 family)
VHEVTWTPNQLAFSSSSGGVAINRWNFVPGPFPVPDVGEARLHLNFYLANGQPAVPADREIVISRVQYVALGNRVSFVRAQDTLPYGSGSYTMPLALDSGCSATVESDSPWIKVADPNFVAAGGSLRYAVMANPGEARVGNLILRSNTCNVDVGHQILAVSQARMVCDATFETDSTHAGSAAAAHPVTLHTTGPQCSWSLSTSSAWLHIASAAAGTGEATVQFSIDANSGPELRQASIFLQNGREHRVYQDASGAVLALSPLVRPSCTGSGIFGAAWDSRSTRLELHMDSPSGLLVGEYTGPGSAALPSSADGRLVYLVDAAGSPPRVLASARTSVLSVDCSSGATFQSILPRGVENSASYASDAIAPGSLVTVFGTNLSSFTALAGSPPLPTRLGGVEVMLGGVLCQLLYVSPSQINLLAPDSIVAGRQTIAIGSAISEVVVAPTAPGIFTAGGSGSAGPPLASVMARSADGSTRDIPNMQCTPSGCNSVPLPISGDTTDLFLVLYGTGIRGQHTVTARLGNVVLDVLYAGAQSSFAGLDQLNLRVRNPGSLTGRQLLRIAADGRNSNDVELLFP